MKNQQTWDQDAWGKTRGIISSRSIASRESWDCALNLVAFCPVENRAFLSRMFERAALSRCR